MTRFLLLAAALAAWVVGCAGPAEPVSGTDLPVSAALPISVGTDSARCLVYGAATLGQATTQIFTVDLATKTFQKLGPAQPDADVAGIAVHPTSRQIYAISGKFGQRAGSLFRMDATTANLVRVGASGFTDLTALSFRATDGTLWSWARGSGLIQLDVSTGVGQQKFSSKEPITEIAWSANGAILYASNARQLFTYVPASGAFSSISRTLPALVGGLHARSDGRLLVVPEKFAHEMAGQTSLDLVNLDSTSGQQVSIYNVTPAGADLSWPGDRSITAIGWNDSCGVPTPRGPAALINDVKLDKSAVCPEEEVRVDVTASHPDQPLSPVEVFVNNKPGAFQYVSFRGGPGLRYIDVYAKTAEGLFDRRQLTVRVIDCPAAAIPRVITRPNPFEPYAIDFEIANAERFGTGARFSWDFGDGSSGSSTIPFVTHSYLGSVDAASLHLMFTATLTVDSGATPVTTKKVTISILNDYVADKNRGYLHPPIVAPRRPSTGGPTRVASVQIRNPEPTAVEFTAQIVEIQPCALDVEPELRPVQPVSIQLPALTTSTREFSLDASATGDATCGVAIHLMGTTPAGVRIRADVNLELRNRPALTHDERDPGTLAALRAIAAQGLVQNPDLITGEDLRRLQHQHLVPYFGSEPAGQVLPLVEHEGEPCVPGAMPPRIGLTCQPTDEFEVVEGYLANAQKGEAVLSTMCGMVSGLLANVRPGQLYSHTGIMTRDHVEIRHSTAASDRPESYADDPLDTGWPLYINEDGSPTDGIQEDAIKYPWPGTITQSVSDAYKTVKLHDPNDKEMSLTSFANYPKKCSPESAITFPKVLRADPFGPPSAYLALRALQRSAADAALTINGHYRFYSYSNAAIAENASFFGPSGSWSAGTQPVVCSSFVWQAFRKIGATLEGELDENDRGLVMLDSQTVDGLYFYDEDERRQAANFLYTYLYNTAYEKAGDFGRFLTDAPSDIANQITNCFASDYCHPDAKDSDAWKNPGVGRAVSPDDMMRWDVYPYSEMLVYRSDVWTRKYAWKVVDGAAKLSGVVRNKQGAAVAGAIVSLVDTGLDVPTDAEGKFAVEDLPAGIYQIHASKLLEFDGTSCLVPSYTCTLHEAKDADGHIPTLTLAPNENKDDVVLVLTPPPEFIRRVDFQGQLYIHDFDSDSPDDEDTFPISATLEVRPDKPTASHEEQHCVDDEVNVLVRVTAVLRADRTGVDVFVYEGLYEWNECTVNPGEFGGSAEFNDAIAAGQSRPVHMSAANLTEDEPETYGILDLTVNNYQAP